MIRVTEHYVYPRDDPEGIYGEFSPYVFSWHPPVISQPGNGERWL